MKVEGELFGKRKGTGMGGQDRVMVVNMIKVYYTHV
jgi:hypothetical protein